MNKRPKSFVLLILIGLVSFWFFKLTFQTNDAQATEVPPPTDLTATITQNPARIGAQSFVDLTWVAPVIAADTPTISGYKIYMNGTPLPLGAFVIPTAYRDAPQIPLPGNDLCYTVESIAVDNTHSVQTSPSCVHSEVGTTHGTTQSPSNLTATAVSSNSVNLRWQFTGGATLVFVYHIERSDNGSSVWSRVGTGIMSFIDNSPKDFTFSDPNLTPASNYRYRVTAFDKTGGTTGTGFSAPSNIATVDTPALGSVPAAPTNLTSSFSSVTSAGLYFKDNSNSEDGFVAERSTDGGSAWSDFATSGRCSTSDGNGCGVPVTLNLNTDYMFRIRAVNTVGRSTPSNEVVTFSTPSGFSWSNPTAENILIIYNALDWRSVEVYNNYMGNRPLISGANILPLHFPPIAPDLDDPSITGQDIDIVDFQTKILKPITDWLSDDSNKDKHIRYIVLMWGMPSRVNGCDNGLGGKDVCPEGSTDYQISRALQTLGVKNGLEYRGVSTRFTPEYYQGTTALVSHIDMGSVEATEAYIDKLKHVYDGMQNKNVVISGRNAGISGDTYYIDKNAQYETESINAVRAENSSANVVYKSSGWFTSANNVLGFATGGSWARMETTHQCGTRVTYNQCGTFAVDGSVVFGGNSNWYIMRTGESWNGVRNNPRSGQSMFSDWFSDNAFGGTSYQNTPVGAVAHVREPGVPSNNELYFKLWERGYPFIEAAWASRVRAPGSIWMTAIGDPLVAIGTAPVTDTTAPTISGGSPSGVLVSGTINATLSVATNENAICKFSATAGISFVNMSRTFTTTGGITHSTALAGLSSGTSYSYYVRCRDAAQNANAEDYPIVFSVAQTVTAAACTDYQYTNWGTCNGETQIRSVNGNLPTGCAGIPPGTPLISQTCDALAADNTPPNIQNSSPFGTLSSSTTSATLSVTTNENATCRYGTTANISYANLSAHPFTATGILLHSTVITGLLPNTSYLYYIRCRDEFLNANLTDYPIAFAVAAGVSNPNPNTVTPPSAPATPASYAQQWQNILTDAAIIPAGDLGAMLSAVGATRNIPAETAVATKYTANVVNGLTGLSSQSKNILTNFITYGTPTTKKLGAGERAGVVNSYKNAFGRVPTASVQWQDAIAIGNGRWPGETSVAAGARAKIEFKKVYGRLPDIKQPNDSAAVMIIAYGLRPLDRNTNSEKAAIKSFKAIYGHAPVSAATWDIVRAIAYSGAKR